MGLSRLMEYLSRQVIQQEKYNVEEYPIAQCGSQVAEGEVEHIINFFIFSEIHAIQPDERICVPREF